MASIDSKIMPPAEQLVELEPEDVGMFVLACLCKQKTNLNRYNFTLSSSVKDYAGNVDRKEVAKILTEGWIWLEREGLIAPQPDQSDDWYFVTRRGYKLNESGDLTKYQNAGFFPVAGLDPVLARKARPLFIRGDLDTSVFQAFKEVEVRTRLACGCGNDVYGRELMKLAFHPETGVLRDPDQEPPEREALYLLFSGAIGLLKNPHSHRNVDLDDPQEAAELIGFANYLLRIVEDRREQIQS